MKLALGTVQFGMNYGLANTSGRIIKDEAGVVLRCASEVGLDTLDTAIAYGDSELVLGALGVGSWKVITKLPAVPSECSEVQKWVEGQVLGSLNRLGVERLEGLLLHRPAQLLEDVGPALQAALVSLKSEGLVNKIGVSVYGPAELDLLFHEGIFDLVQAPLNILDRRLVDSGWGNRLKQAGVEVHTRSTFLQGLLLMPANARPAKFGRWAEFWNEWDRWLLESNLSPLQACLRYAISQDCISRVVIGVDSVNQLIQIVDAAVGELPSLPAYCPLRDDRLINPASWAQL